MVPNSRIEKIRRMSFSEGRRSERSNEILPDFLGVLEELLLQNLLAEVSIIE